MNDQILMIGDHRLPLRLVQTPDGILRVPRYVYRASDELGWQVMIQIQASPVR